MNLMLTDFCNLHCSYCFAKDAMSKTVQEMTEENFRYCLDFLKKSGEERVNLIGGEPTLHSQFTKFINIIEEYKFSYIQLFTNGVFEDKILKCLMKTSVEVTALINVNSPRVIGIENYERIRLNIEKLLSANKRIVLGINIYQTDMNIEFFKHLVKDLHIANLRWSVAVPSKHVDDSFGFYSQYKHIVLDLLEWAYNNRIHTTCDCNRIPMCVWTDSELRLIATYEPDMLVFKQCLPVIDVFPNLDIIRCFGTCNNYMSNLKKYNSIRTMRVDFTRKVDMPAYECISDPKCMECILYKNKECRKSCISML